MSNLIASNWKQQAEVLTSQGKSWRKIAKEIGVARSTVSDHLRKVFKGSGTLSLNGEIIGTVSDFSFSPSPVAIATQKSTKQGKKYIVIPDTQCKPGISLEYLRWIGEYIAEKKPDVIVHLGDHADMESLSSYDKGKKSAEGKRVAKDIEAAIAGMNALLAPIKREQVNDTSWKPEMVFILGNHECLKPNVEVLTDRGFVKITDVTETDLIAQRGVGGETVWGKYLAVVNKQYVGDTYNWNSRSLSLSCTENHRVLRKTSAGKAVYSLAKDVPSKFEVYGATSNNSGGVSLLDNEIKLGAWLCTDSYFTSGNQVILYQRESNAYKIENLLNSLGVDFKKVVRDRDIKQICGKILKKKCEKSVEFFLDSEVALAIGVSSNTELPSWAKDLNNEQWSLFLETIIDADGTIPTKAVNSRVFYGKHRICEHLQSIAVTKGWCASLTEYRENQWRVNLTKQLSRRQENTEKVVEHYEGMVHCLLMPEGNFIIRDNNKVHVTGNCRIARHVEANPELDGFLGYESLKYEEMGWEVYDYLQPAILDGICFIHYYPNPFTGKPYGGNAANMLQKVGTSFVQGHRQTLDVATRTLHNGEHQWGIIAGSCYVHSEGYKGYTGNKHWRGIITLHNVHNGGFDPLFVGLDYLEKRYAIPTTN